MAESRGDIEFIDLEIKQEVLSDDDVDNGSAHEIEDLATVMEMLELNRQYQKTLNAHILQLDNLLQENLDKQQHVTNEIAKTRTLGKHGPHEKPLMLFAAPYFRNVKANQPLVYRYHPKKNQDALEKKRDRVVDAYVEPLRPWTSREYDSLKFGVYENVKQRLTKPLKDKIAAIEEKLNGELRFSDEDQQKLLQLVEEYKEEIKDIMAAPSEDLAERYKDVIDWLAVSATYLSGDKTADYCELMWENFLRPKINKKEFTDDEDKKLKELVKEQGERDWELVALRLSTGRTAIQCLERYQSHHNPRISKDYWTKDEDEQLKKLVNKYLMGNYIPWEKVMYDMYGRDRSESKLRWNTYFAPGLLAGNFCAHEDCLIIAAVHKYTNDFTKIRDFIPWRSLWCVKQRFASFLNTDIVTQSWDLEEDLKLLNQIAIHGEGNWSTICQSLPNRTHDMCNTRAIIFKRNDPELYEFLISKKHSLIKDDPRYPTEQFAISKQHDRRNVTRRSLREKAIETYLTLYKELTGIEDVDSLIPSDSDIIMPSLKLLRSMRDYVVEHCPHRQNLGPAKPDYDLVEHRANWAKGLTSDRLRRYPSDDDLFNEIQSDEEVTEEKEKEVEKKLDALFAPLLATGIKLCSIEKLSFNSAGKDFVIYQLLKEMLFKDFGVLTDEDVFDEPINIKRVNVDLRKTTPLMFRTFIMPKCKEDALPIIPPNNATVISTLILLVNRREAKEDASSVTANGTIHNIKATSSDVNSDRACAFCSWKKAGRSEKTFPKEMTCCCESILGLRERLLLMRRRFVCAFLMPFMLTEKALSSQQAKSFFCQDPQERKPQKVARGRKRKRGRRKFSMKKVMEGVRRDKIFEAALCSQPKKTPVLKTRTRCVKSKSLEWDNKMISGGAASPMEDEEVVSDPEDDVEFTA